MTGAGGSRRAWVAVSAIMTVLAGTALVLAADKPSVKIFYTASVKGSIDQCGCRYNPTGGIERRATYLERTIDSSVPTLILDGGDVLGNDDSVGRMQTRYLLRAMKEMGYHTIGLGPRDFVYGVEFLRQAEREFGFEFTSANVLDDATGRPAFAPYVVEEVSGRGLLGRPGRAARVGVVSVMGLDRPPLALETDPSFRLGDPIRSVRSAVNDLRGRTDLIVVLAYTSEAELDSLEAIDGVDVVVSARPLQIPPEWVKRTEHGVVGYSSFQGRGVGWIDVTLDGAHHVSRAAGDLAMMTADIPNHQRMMALKHEFEQWKANATESNE